MSMRFQSLAKRNAAHSGTTCTVVLTAIRPHSGIPVIAANYKRFSQSALKPGQSAMSTSNALMPLASFLV